LAFGGSQFLCRHFRAGRFGRPGKSVVNIYVGRKSGGRRGRSPEAGTSQDGHGIHDTQNWYRLCGSAAIWNPVPLPRAAADRSRRVVPSGAGRLARGCPRHIGLSNAGRFPKTVSGCGYLLDAATLFLASGSVPCDTLFRRPPTLTTRRQCCSDGTSQQGMQQRESLLPQRGGGGGVLGFGFGPKPPWPVVLSCVGLATQSVPTERLAVACWHCAKLS
jgi:hypothetical protein